MGSQAHNHRWHPILSPLPPLAEGVAAYLQSPYYCSISSSYSFGRNTRSHCLQCIDSTPPPIVPMHLPCSHLLVSSILHKPCWRNVSPHDSIPMCYILSFSQLSWLTWGSSLPTILLVLLPRSVILLLPTNVGVQVTAPRFHGYFQWLQLCAPHLTFWSNQIWFCSCSWQTTIGYDGNHTTLSHTCRWSSISSSFSIHHLNGKPWDSSSWSGHPSRCIVIHSCRHEPTRLVF